MITTDLRQIISIIDYSNIQSYKVTDADCENLALKAIVYGFGTVVVGPSSLSAIEEILKGKNIKTAVSIAYPSGAYLLKSKTDEIKELLETKPYIDEFYAVLAVGRFLSGYADETRREIEGIVRAAGKRTVKIVIEAGIMDFTQKKTICDMVAEAGAEYIVASTGFIYYDVPIPTEYDIKELVEVAEGRIKIIACGGVDTADAAIKMLNAGADRICTEKAFEIISELR
jgi:deoxyribose-phosphate aldolase